MIPSKPKNISPLCDFCGDPLGLVDLVYCNDTNTIAYPNTSEWCCPRCRDGLIYWDGHDKDERRDD
jgi:hypothetical protein